MTDKEIIEVAALNAVAQEIKIKRLVNAGRLLAGALKLTYESMTPPKEEDGDYTVKNPVEVFKKVLDTINECRELADIPEPDKKD